MDGRRGRRRAPLALDPEWSVAVTRVLLARLPAMLGDIVRSLAAGRADVVVVDEVGAVAAIPAAMRAAGASAVVAGGVAPAARPALLAAMLAVRADARLVALDEDGTGATLATARGERRVAALSARGLLELVRG